MLFKIIFIALFLGIVGSLIHALISLLKHQEPSSRVVKALAWRAGLSVTLFLFLIALDYFGVVQLHGLSGIQPTT
jgi:hypothetical protein